VPCLVARQHIVACRGGEEPAEHARNAEQGLRNSI